LPSFCSSAWPVRPSRNRWPNAPRPTNSPSWATKSRVAGFLPTETGFTGTINNQPRMVKSVRYGQQYNFIREQIVDWAYIDRDQKRMVGNFTVCALLTKESVKEAEATKKKYGLQCD
jgi:uncharacterized protein YegJ (DUF2314 family)